MQADSSDNFAVRLSVAIEQLVGSQAVEFPRTFQNIHEPNFVASSRTSSLQATVRDVSS